MRAGKAVKSYVMASSLSVAATIASAMTRFCASRPCRQTPKMWPSWFTPRARPDDQRALCYGSKIYYAEAGSGPTLILLHGLVGSWQNWMFNIDSLAAKFHVFAPDQLGFGKSDKPLINYRIGTYVDFLDQFCKQLKLERASLMGVSMGGWVAAAYAIAHPDKVERMVLVDAAGYAPQANFDN